MSPRMLMKRLQPNSQAQSSKQQPVFTIFEIYTIKQSQIQHTICLSSFRSIQIKGIVPTVSACLVLHKAAHFTSVAKEIELNMPQSLEMLDSYGAHPIFLKIKFQAIKSRWLQLLQDQSLVSYFIVNLTLAQELFILNQIHGISNISLKIKDSSTYVSSDNRVGFHCFCQR